MGPVDNGGLADDEFSAEVTGERGGTVVVTVAGEIDIDTTDSLERAVHEAVQLEPTRLVFDLEAVEFMDSSGIAALVHARSAVDEVFLRNPSIAVRRILETTGLGSTFRIEPT